MIKSIHLKNFGCYIDKKLEFHPRLNVIVGLNDAGKTTFIRAFDLLFNNQPSGADYITNTLQGTNTLEIDVRKDDHQIIRRIKYKQDKEKTVKKDDEYEVDGKILKAFGRNIPAEVAQTSRFTDLNIQFQTDGPFLLLNSSGEVARYLNRTIDLEVIDEAFTNINKTKRANNAKINQTEEELKKIEVQLKEFDNIDSIKLKVEEIEELANNLKNNLDKITKISRSIDSIELLLLDLREVKETLFYSSNVATLNKLIEELSKKEKLLLEMENKLNIIETKNEQLKVQQDISKQASRINTLVGVNKTYTENRTKYNNLKNLLSIHQTYQNRLKYLGDIINNELEINMLVSLHQELENNIKRNAKITDLIISIKKKEKLLDIKKTKTKQLEKQFKDILGTVCPLCKQEIKKEN